MSIEFGVGKELRAARLKAELKVTDVADELNLKVEHITAIEKDNYQELPGNTYVIGFVRSYAKFLGLNDVHMVDRLMQSGLIASLQPTEPHIQAEESVSMQEPDKKFVVRFVIVSIVAIFLVLVFFTVKNLPEDDVSSVIEEDVVVPENKEAEKSAQESTNSKAMESQVETKGLTDDEVAKLLKPESKVEEKAQKKIKLVGTKPKGARVMLTAKEDAWYQVYNNKTGRVYQNAVLKKGHSVWVQPGNNILMDLGRPHMMIISVDGKEYGQSGPSWGGVIKKLSADPSFLVYDFYGERLNEKSYNRWKRRQEESQF